MSSNGPQPFDSNWAYLKTELRWLDRLLMLAVSRQRQDDKTINQVANTPADKVTSHWWKGIITVKRGIDDREGPAVPSRPKGTPTVSYSQHLDERIRASQQAGILLALPDLRDRFTLTDIEKNILLLALAPEVNRRYGRLYNYLQEDAGVLEDLPTVDLCLRLLCRNDQAWQAARARLTAPDSLVNRGLVEWIGDEDGTLLSQQVRLTDGVINYLLADVPDPARLQSALPAKSVSAPVAGTPDDSADGADGTAGPPSLAEVHDDEPSLSSQQVERSWDQLVLPAKLIQQLQHLVPQAAQRQTSKDLGGLVVLLVGDHGTGKTLAAGTLAAALETSLTCVDLNALSPEDYPSVLTDAPDEGTSLLLVKQGEQWFGRKPQVHLTWLHQWWQWRKQHYGLTLVTTYALQAIKPSWRQKFDGILSFPCPDTQSRRQLWQQALTSTLKTHTVDWDGLAEKIPVTGGDISAIAKTVHIDLQARSQKTLTLKALKAAIALHHPQIDTRGLRSKRVDD